MIKKSYVELFEILFIVVIVLGFVLSALITSSLLRYVFAAVLGFILGRIFFERQKKPLLPLIFLAIAFIFGYVVASFNTVRVIIIIIFLFFTILSYSLYKEKIIKI